MKRTILLRMLTATFLSLIFLAGTASASFSDLGDGVIRDNVNNLYWIQDLSLLTDMTYDEQLTAIGALSSDSTYGTYGEWRLATEADALALWREYGSLELMAAFNPSALTDLTNGRTEARYRGRTEWNLTGTGSRAIDTYGIYDADGNLSLSVKGLNNYTFSESERRLGAFVVADVAPVPVPPALLLFGSGLTMAAGLRRGQRKQK